MRPRELRGKPGRLRLLRAAAGLAAAEALYATAGVDQLLAPGVERVAVGADLHVYLRLRRTGYELVPAGTAHVRLDVLRMDVGLHVIEDSRGDQGRTARYAAASSPRPRSSVSSATRASTTAGSNWRPELRVSSAIA